MIDLQAVPIPERLRTRAAQDLDEVQQAAATQGIVLTLDAALADEAQAVFASSRFVAQTCRRHPSLFQDLIASGDLEARREPEALRERVRQALAAVADEPALLRVLRAQRRREMIRIAWRDLSGRADLQETTTELSILAETCIDGALTHLHAWQSAERGRPCDAEGRPQALVVLGMGKLGAGELNYSSDIDLILAYPEEGETRDGPRPLSNEEYFRRLGQRLASALGQATEDGFVFRVDLRLRPFGDSGPLAMSFDAMEAYYQNHGREWERYAMIKARVVGGDRTAGAALLKLLRPFVYRRYLDYAAFESLRDMKELIAREVRRRDMADNVKLGPGGIREIEFIGQAFQLIRGGRVPELRDPRILLVLQLLAERNYLPDYVVRELTEAYVFLRRVEHRLQEYADEQTHALPEDDPGRERLAFSMGYPSWLDFEPALRRHRQKVQGHFEQLVTAPQSERAAAEGSIWTGLWRGGVAEPQAEALLANAGFADPGEVLRLLERLRTGASLRALSARGRERLDQLLPLLIGAAAGTERPGETLQRLMVLIETIARRTAYVALLLENPMALSQLVRLCAASGWIARLLARHPLLLDELLDPRSLYAPPDRAGLAVELAERLARVDPEDLEQQMETLRHFKQANVLRVAAADIAAAMPLMIVSDRLTWIAEVILEQVIAAAWAHLTGRHGRPPLPEGQTGFLVVGYGKLGGLELGYGSDLDLVFIYSAGEGATGGSRPLDSSVFYARLAQRAVNALTTHTPSGILYEIDLRLRPSGASGLLVSSIDAFAEYQQREAWTWEHQALVRARPVAGDPMVAARFEAVRAEVLRRSRDRAALRAEVRQMRARMREELASREPGQFDLKQAAGGIADIEFMVQYGVLAWACEHPQLCRFTDNIRLLQLFADAGLMSAADAQLLSDAYRAYRARVHRLVLQDALALVPDTEFVDYRDGVSRIWQALLEND